MRGIGSARLVRRALGVVAGVVITLAGIAAGGSGLRANEWPGAWLAAEAREHPLAGKIYDVAGKRFVAAGDYLADLAKARHVLLGEIHDNPDHHRLQGWVIRRLGGGERAVVFEQFRADQQDVLDAFVAGLGTGGGSGEDEVEKLFLVTGWARSGWPEASIYEPLMAAVVAGRMGMLAGNPPRQRVIEVARQGLAAISSDAQRRLLLDRELGAILDEALLEELEASHCGLMPKSAFTNMAKAQRFKDGFMARVMADAEVGGRGTVLISSNGHVRRDRGVPWYLERMRGEGQEGVRVVGHVEVDAARQEAGQYAAAGVYDYIVFTPVATRPDPCEEMRKRFQKRGDKGNGGK